MVKVSERGGGWGMNVGIDADFDHSLNFDDYEHVKLTRRVTPSPYKKMHGAQTDALPVPGSG